MVIHEQIYRVVIEGSCDLIEVLLRICPWREWGNSQNSQAE